MTPVTPRDRAEALLHRAKRAVSGIAPAPGDTPDSQEAQALARRYLEAGRREWERHNWGSASLFADLALEWAARASEDISHGPANHPGG